MDNIIGKPSGKPEDVDIGGFQVELSRLINRYSIENLCDTPDHILAEYCVVSLLNFSEMVRDRDKWWKFEPWKH